MTASQSQSQSHCSDVDHLTLLMLNSRLVEDGELWFPQIKLLIMCPVVQLQSIICVHESSSCFAWSLTLSIIAIQSRSMVRFLDTFRRLPHTASFSLLQHYFGLNSSSLRGNFQHDDKRPLIIIAMFAIFFFIFITIFENRRQVCIMKFWRGSVLSGTGQRLASISLRYNI